VLKGEPVTREELGLQPATIRDGRSARGFVLASKAGIHENCVPLRAQVEAGDLVGKIHDFDHPDVEPIELYAHTSGVINLIRGFPPVTTGDVVCVVTPKYSSLAEMERVAG
jgi:predicted deacylase